MIASNGHAPKAFRRNAQPHIYVCSKGFRGAAPDKQREVFAAAETARKAKWVPLCPACPFVPSSLQPMCRQLVCTFATSPRNDYSVIHKAFRKEDYNAVF